MGSELLRKYRRSVIKSFTFSHYSYFCGAFQSLRPNEKNFKKMISKHILLRIWWLAPNLEFPISNEATGQIFDVAIADNILISCQPNNQSCKNRFLDERCEKEYLKTQRMPLPFHPAQLQNVIQGDLLDSQGFPYFELWGEKGGTNLLSKFCCNITIWQCNATKCNEQTNATTQRNDRLSHAGV